MSPTFTEEDVGKRVENRDGEELGVVVAIDRETAYVEPESDAADASAGEADSGGASEPDDEDVVPLGDDAVDRITDDAVRVDPEFPEESLTTGTAVEEDGAGDESASPGREDGDYDPGEPVASEPTETETGPERPERAGGTAPADESEPDVPGRPNPVESDRSEPDVTGRPEPGATDQPDDADGELADAAEEIDGDAERRDVEGMAPGVENDPVGEIDDTGTTDGAEGASTGDGPSAEELESVEERGSRDLEVDPSELTEGEPEAELEPGEDVGRRTDPSEDAEEDGDE